MSVLRGLFRHEIVCKFPVIVAEQSDFRKYRAKRTKYPRKCREMEQMKREITEDVMSRISIRLEDEALKQLRDMLNGLGK